MTSETSILPPASAIPALSLAERSDILTFLFEHSSALETLLQADLASASHHSYQSLISSVAARLNQILSHPSSDTPLSVLDDILSCHPRLGASTTTALSAASTAEQSQLRSAATDEEAQAQAAELVHLNEKYESQFGGIVYLTFVNGRPRRDIMDDMRRRMDRNDVNAERRDGIVSLCDIARDRLSKAKIADGVDNWRQG